MSGIVSTLHRGMPQVEIQRREGQAGELGRTGDLHAGRLGDAISVGVEQGPSGAGDLGRVVVVAAPGGVSEVEAGLLSDLVEPGAGPALLARLVRRLPGTGHQEQRKDRGGGGGR